VLVPVGHKHALAQARAGDPAALLQLALEPTPTHNKVAQLTRQPGQLLTSATCPSSQAFHLDARVPRLNSSLGLCQSWALPYYRPSIYLLDDLTECKAFTSTADQRQLFATTRRSVDILDSSMSWIILAIPEMQKGGWILAFQLAAV